MGFKGNAMEPWDISTMPETTGYLEKLKNLNHSWTRGKAGEVN